MSNTTIHSTRCLSAPIDRVYEAFANPQYLKEWWGPEGFTNTIHEFDLRVGGKWRLTMHGPEKGNYENAAIFTLVESGKRVAWTRESQPYFDMEVGFEKVADGQTVISFTMVFGTAEECEKMKKFVEPKNEENFDRLERVLVKMQEQGL